MPYLLQAGAVPYRLSGGQPEFLLVTSRQGNWIFPKGRIAPGHTPEETAGKEAEEEAGVLGTVLPGPIASYDDDKAWTPFHVQMYLLEYAEESPTWLEARARARRWCTFEDAARLLKKKDLHAVLEAALRRVEALGAAPSGEPPGPLTAPPAPPGGGGS